MNKGGIMPENVLNNQQDEEKSTDTVNLVKAEFDPEKESNLREQIEQNESNEQVENDNTEQNEVEESQKMSEEAPSEERVDEGNQNESEILQDLKALATAETIQTDIERSKVAEVNAQNFLAELDETTQKAWSEANSELSQISLHRSVIESEFQSALKNFDIAKATSLEKKINELSKLYTQKQAEANLVNLKLNEQLSAAFTKWKKWTAEFLNSIRHEDGYKKAYYIMEKVKLMDKEKALSLLSEPEIEAHLGVWLTPVKDFVERKQS